VIDLTNKIENDLSSDVNNFDLLFIINSSGNTYRLATKSQTFDGNYYDDLIMRVGGLKESIDLRSKKVKLTGTTISINNAQINGTRFSDTIVGEMSGGTIDIYIKTPSCQALEDDCIRIALLKITSISHDNSKIDLKCEDRYIDEIHKELPSSDYTLYQDEQTFVGDNERRIPVLYGHLKQAPAVVYINNHETESPFANNNVFIVPDRAFLDDYDIVGIKSIGGFDSLVPNQLIKQDVLSIKLGDHAANVYSTPPDRLNLKMVDGDENNDYEFETRWTTQFTISDDKDYVNLFTESHADASKHITSGNLLCGEVSKLLSVNAYKPKFLRKDEYDTSMGDAEHYSDLNIESGFSSPHLEDYFDMLSVSPVKLDSIMEESQDGYIDLEYNTEIWHLLEQGLERHFNFNALVFEIEFEPLKANISRAKGRQSDTYVDANLVTSFDFKNLPTTILSETSSISFSGDPIHSFEFCLFPQQPSYDTYNTNFAFDLLTGEIFEYSLDKAGAVRDIYSSKSSSISPLTGEPYTSYLNWDEEEDNSYEEDEEGYNIDHNWELFSKFFRRTAPLRVYMKASREENVEIEDYRHTFHTERQSQIGNWVNTWRMYYRWIDGVNWISQNVFTGYITPRVEDAFNWNPVLEKFVHGVKMDFSGMFLKRTWYQENSFNENFFVNAKGKYIDFPNPNNLIVYADKVNLSFNSTSLDYDSDVTFARNEDKALLQLIDYLTNDRLKEFYANGYKYELVVDCTNYRYDATFDSEQLILFDFDVNSFRVNHLANNIKYIFDISSNIFRKSTSTGGWIGADYSYCNNVKLRYARRVVTSSGVLDSWIYLDEEDDSSNPFVISIDYDYDANEHNIEQVQMIEFENDNTNNKDVSILINGYEIDDAKQLIRQASDVADDIVFREMGFPLNTVYRKNIDDKRYLLDFSLYKEEEGIDIMQKISQCSPFFYRTRMSDGIPSIVGIKHFYADNDVDKSINENQILSYKFTRSKIEDVALKCRVKYGFDYVKEEYLKVTDDIEHSSDEIKTQYKNYYNIEDDDTYTLEYEAPYIQEKVSAEVLAKHLFEMNKNQHLKLSFKVPLGDAIELEVGDTIDFVDNLGSRTNISNTKPYGMDMTIENLLIDQTVYPYFMITSIKKDLTSVDIECVQLHELAPSIYDELFAGEIADDEEDVEPEEDSIIPIVDAGEDQFAVYGQNVTLNGSAFSEVGNNILGYYWSQTSGTLVDVDNYEQASITFPAPENTEVISFTLQAYDDQFNFSELDTVNIYVGLGDVNADQNIDILDVITSVNLVLNGQYAPEADLNQDGVVTVMDIVTLLNQILDE
tara:strand:- start:5301 stop:9257 length:3957 start_codon:yes stop_codon:yes gene_type:complete